MSINRPYMLWTREELFSHCERLCYHYGADDLLVELKKIIFDIRWDPIKDYNGCNVIQDKHHPYPPCLIHDFRWLVEGGGIKSDIEFKLNMRLFDESKLGSFKNFIGVRIGWWCWFKWEKMWKRYKNRK